MATYYAARADQIEAANLWYDNVEGAGDPIAFANLQPTDTLDANGFLISLANQTDLTFGELSTLGGGSFAADDPDYNQIPLTLRTNLRAAQGTTLYVDRPCVVQGILYADSASVIETLSSGSYLEVYGEIHATGGTGISLWSTNTLYMVGNIYASQGGIGIYSQFTGASIYITEGLIQATYDAIGIYSSYYENVVLDTVNIVQHSGGTALYGCYRAWMGDANYLGVGNIHFCIEPPAEQLLLDQVCGRVTGLLIVPANTDVRAGVTVGLGTQGSAYVVNKKYVLKGEPIDNTTGTLACMRQVGAGGLVLSE